ncbi:MAG: flagellar hook capping FlgD N-terminal domain-containing protein [Opitutaceae bacterium]
MPISPIGSGSSAALTGNEPAPARTPKHRLDPTDFMKLLTVQLQNQDPMAPMDNNEQMAQIAQISSMESMTKMAEGFTRMSLGQTLILANSYLGQQVTMRGTDGNDITGKVTAVDASEPTLKLQINGTYYPLDALLRVELPPPSQPVPADGSIPPVDGGPVGTIAALR